MRFTAAAKELIKRLEGCRLAAYRDQGGVWTVGYGHTGPEVHPGVVWTQAQADEALNDDLQRFCLGVERQVAKAPRPLNDNQFSALVIFAFNVGTMALWSSTAMHHIQAGQLDLVPAALALWNKVRDASGVPVMNAILVKRRAAEGELWNTPVEVT